MEKLSDIQYFKNLQQIYQEKRNKKEFIIYSGATVSSIANDPGSEGSCDPVIFQIW